MLSTRNCGWYDKCILRIRYINRKINKTLWTSSLYKFIFQDLILILSTNNFIFWHFILIFTIILILFHDDVG